MSTTEPKLGLKRVEVTWEDICTHAGWFHPTDPIEPTIVTQIGYLHPIQDKKYIKLISSYYDDEVGDVTQIPRALVITIRKI